MKAQTKNTRFHGWSPRRPVCLVAGDWDSLRGDLHFREERSPYLTDEGCYPPKCLRKAIKKPARSSHNSTITKPTHNTSGGRGWRCAAVSAARVASRMAGSGVGVEVLVGVKTGKSSVISGNGSRVSVGVGLRVMVAVEVNPGEGVSVGGVGPTTVGETVASSVPAMVSVNVGVGVGLSVGVAS